MVTGHALARPGRRAVIDLFLFAFALDLICGMVAPTFSLYVTSLHGSTITVGLLAATVSMTELLGAFPLGALSDRLGRKVAIVGGSLVFSLSCVLAIVPSQPLLLLVMRIAYGVALLATFPIGLAYLSDAVAARRRALAISVYVSGQGFGFTAGGLLGGWIAATFGYSVLFETGALIALATALIASYRLDGSHGRNKMPHVGLLAMRSLLRRPLLGANMSNFFMLLMANGFVLPFLSLDAVRIGVSTFMIGVLYGVRSAVSVLARLPSGLLSSRSSQSRLVLVALGLDACAAIGYSLSSSSLDLFAAAIVDGLAFGLFMTAGQCLVAADAPTERRGGAIGSFAATGALGETIGALSAGVLADVVGIRAVFLLGGLLLFLCVPLVRGLLREGLLHSRVSTAA